ALVSRRTRRDLRLHPTRRDSLLRPYARWRVVHLFALFSLFGMCLYCLGWGWAANRIAAGLPGTELLLLAPILGAQGLCWVFFYDAERAFHDTLAEPDIRPYWTRWAYVGYHIRQNLALVCIPVALLILDKTVRRLVGNASPDWQAFFSGVRIALVLGV